MENADLLSNAAAAIERLKADERLLELEITGLQRELETKREVLGLLTGKPRLRRARTAKLIEMGEGRSNLPLQMPDRVAGGIAEAPTEPDLVA